MPDLEETLKQLFIAHPDVEPNIATANLVLENCDDYSFSLEGLEDSLNRLIAKGAVLVRRKSQAELDAEEAALAERDQARYVYELNHAKTGESREAHLERIRKAAKRERVEQNRHFNAELSHQHERTTQSLRDEIRTAHKPQDQGLPYEIQHRGSTLTLDSAGLRALLSSRREADETLVRKMISLYGIDTINQALRERV